MTNLETSFEFINDIRDEVLPNGVRVLLLPRHEVPSVAIGLYLRAGSVHDPADRFGLANLTARGVGDGTLKRTKEVLDEEIDFVGGSYQFSAGMEGSSGGMQFLAAHLPFALDVLADTVTRPMFPPEEVSRGRKQIVGSIQSQLERPGDLCERRYQEQLFHGTAYGHNIDGEIDSVERITRDDLVEFHSAHFAPETAIITLVGDFEPAQTLERITEEFSAWRGASPVDGPTPAFDGVGGIQCEVIDRPVQQANIRLGWPTIPRLHPDYYPLVMMNYILGASSLSSRIATTVRDNQGLAYQVTSRYVPMRHVGIFSVILQTSNHTANRALQGVRSEMERMMAAPVEDWEIDDARSYFRDRFPLTIETNSSMAGQLVNVARYNLPLTHFRDHLAAISAVTREDIQRAAQTYLHPDQFVLTVVGNAAEAAIELAGATTAATQ